MSAWTANDLKNAGYVLTPSGYRKLGSGNTHAQGHSGAAQPGQPEQSQERPGEPQGKLPHSELQERQAVDHEAAQRQAAQPALPDYVPGVSEVDGESRPEFRISITLFVSNRGRRDPTGALETLCDVLTAARRRLRERLDRGGVESGTRPARRGRGANRDRKASLKEWVPF